MHFFEERFARLRKSIYLCPRLRNVSPIGLWCNGNTADSGPAFPGSSPGSPTEKKKAALVSGFLRSYLVVLFFFFLTSSLIFSSKHNLFIQNYL